VEKLRAALPPGFEASSIEITYRGRAAPSAARPKTTRARATR
jgi:hypothetical protein